MSLRFPGFIFQEKQPIDPDWVNEATLPFYHEASGNLNEQNFAKDAIKPNGAINRAKIIKYSSQRVYVAISDPDQSLIPTDINALEVVTKNSWIDLDLEVSIPTDGGLVYIFASFFITSTSGIFDTVGANAGYKFALKLNDQIMIESLVGSGEPEQEVKGFKEPDGTPPDEVDELLLGVNSPGLISHSTASLNLDYQAMLPQGTHTAKVCIYLESKQEILTETSIVISNRELTMIEFAR